MEFLEILDLAQLSLLFAVLVIRVAIKCGAGRHLVLEIVFDRLDRARLALLVAVSYSLHVIPLNLVHELFKSCIVKRLVRTWMVKHQ